MQIGTKSDMKKVFKILIGTTLLLYLLNEPLFRLLISYQPLDSRPPIHLTDFNLKRILDQKTEGRDLNIDDIVELASELTTSHLSFTPDKASANPNELVTTKKANCVGYAAMFNSIASYLIKKEELQEQYSVQNKVGKLYILGFDLHQFSNTPFFKDHDFNLITNSTTGEKYGIDTSVSDYLGVDYIRVK